MSSELIRTHEALALLGVSPRTFNRLTADAGITHAFRDKTSRGRPAYWRRSEIEEIRAEYRQEGRA